MKLVNVILLVIFLASCFGRRQKVISGLEGKSLPSYNLLLTDSATVLNTANIPTGHAFVLFYFNPFCPYCRAQTDEIKEDIKSLKRIHFYFLSGHPLYQIREFDKRYNLSRLDNITVAQIKDSSFTKYFKVIGVPYFAIFNKEKMLKEVLLGKVNTSDIRSAALEK